MAASTQSALAPELATQLSAILHGAAVAVLGDRGFLRITGPDAARWLNGMVTNAIQTLQPGEGNYNFLLNSQGRILGDMYVYNRGEYLLLDTDQAQVAAIMKTLDHFIIMDDVELSDASETSSKPPVARSMRSSSIWTSTSSWTTSSSNRSTNIRKQS